MYYRFANKVGFFFEDTYFEKWGSSYIDTLATVCSEEEFHTTIARLTVKRANSPDLNGFSEEFGYYFTDSCFYDKKLGVLIEKVSTSDFVISASQDCTEWIMLMSEIVMLKSGMAIVHAAALEKDGSALFLPAKGGVGKTATVVKMIREHGWKLLGDDLTVLDGESGAIYPFHKPFVIYGYHHDLFPELFEKANAPIRNDALSHMMTKMIPTAKKILRRVPGLLRYAREHNPQQVRVRPDHLFKPEALSVGAYEIGKTLWLERIEDRQVRFVPCNAAEIASRCASVTVMELTYGLMNLNLCLSLMSANGMLDYGEIYPQIYKIILKCISQTKPGILGIPRSYPVDRVPEFVLKNI